MAIRKSKDLSVVLGASEDIIICKLWLCAGFISLHKSVATLQLVEERLSIHLYIISYRWTYGFPLRQLCRTSSPLRLLTLPPSHLPRMMPPLFCLLLYRRSCYSNAFWFTCLLQHLQCSFSGLSIIFLLSAQALRRPVVGFWGASSTRCLD